MKYPVQRFSFTNPPGYGFTSLAGMKENLKGRYVRFTDYEHLKRMLRAVLDAQYGAAVHHIGDGDGLNPDTAKEIQEFWEYELHTKVNEG